MVNDRPADSFAAARRAMIDSQLRVSGVNEEVVLNAVNAVAREAHVPADAKAHAYIDRAVPLERWHEAFDAMAGREIVGKIVLEP